MAGNGKTTICHHVLRQWLQNLLGRVVYLVQVEFITTVAGLALALGSLCDLKPELATPDKVIATLADLPIGILYLDNLESVLDDPEAHQFLGRLKLLTNLTFLASSRREVAGFTRIRLDVLDEPDAIELFQSLGLSLNRLQGWPNALRLLALCAVYKSGLNGPMQKLLLQADIFTPSDRSLLMERNLIRYKEGFLSVLPPMVRFIRSVLTAENDLFDKNILFQDSECIAKADYIPVPNRLEFLDFYAKSKRYDLEQVISSFDSMDFLNHLFLAHPILEQLIETTFFCSSVRQKVHGNLFEYLGQIDFRKGGNDNARKRYQQADELYRKVTANRDVAETLLFLADINFEAKSPSSELTKLLTEAGQLIEQFDLAYLNDKLTRLQSHLTE